MAYGIVISLCDYTTNMVRPWAEAGYKCYCVDTQHERGESADGNVIRVGADVTRWLPPRDRVAMFFAAPPCTDMAVSGARWFKDESREKGLPAIIQALSIAEACRRVGESTGAPFMLENPVSTLSSYWRKPNHIVHPYYYGGYIGLPDVPCSKCPHEAQAACKLCKGTGMMDNPENDAYTKKTCLWTSNGFVLPDRKEVYPVLGSKMHTKAPSDTRQEERSETPMGLAKAVFEANHPCVERAYLTAKAFV